MPAAPKRQRGELIAECGISKKKFTIPQSEFRIITTPSILYFYQVLADFQDKKRPETFAIDTLNKWFQAFFCSCYRNGALFR
jgi:hypothetical protein